MGGGRRVKGRRVAEKERGKRKREVGEGRREGGEGEGVREGRKWRKMCKFYNVSEGN